MLLSQVGFEQESESKYLESAISALPGGSITVMIVDDHVLIRQAISHILSSQPVIERVVTAQDYAEAREQAAKLQPAIIWLDMRISCSSSITEIGRLRKVSPA